MVEEMTLIDPGSWDHTSAHLRKPLYYRSITKTTAANRSDGLYGCIKVGLSECVTCFERESLNLCYRLAAVQATPLRK